MRYTLKTRHILLAILAVLSIAFLQPLITFLGGAALLLGAGALIFRDLPPTSQDAVERQLLKWLRQARPASAEDAGLRLSAVRLTPQRLTKRTREASPVYPDEREELD